MASYTELKSELADWLNRPEAEPQLGRFIALAEAEMDRALGEAGVAAALVRATMTITGERIAAPNDLARLVSLTLDGEHEVEVTTAAGIEILRAEEGGTSGRPRLCALAGTELVLHPPPDRAYAAELAYQARLERLSDEVPANWLLAGHYDVYLFGALSEAASFLAEEARAGIWRRRFVAALTGAIAAERARRGERRTPAFRARLPIGACR